MIISQIIPIFEDFGLKYDLGQSRFVCAFNCLEQYFKPLCDWLKVIIYIYGKLKVNMILCCFLIIWFGSIILFFNNMCYTTKQ